MNDPRMCFVAMPFRRDLRNVYDAIETVVTEQCGLKCIRADKIPRSDRITDDIRGYIKNARIVIADLTDINPNVFYEVGFAHGREKRVVLLVQSGVGVPFNVRELRYLTYESDDLNSLKIALITFVRTAISTIPLDWNPSSRPGDWNGAYIKISSLEAPSVVQLGQPFELNLTARNNGRDAHQGYFSVSFPDGVDRLSAESNAESRLGLKGDSWKNGRLVLRYPIAEAFRYSSEAQPAWASGQEYALTVRGYAKRKGLLWYYINASSYDAELNDRRWDPKRGILDKDQRDENVYCGTIEVH
jgi:hypothetical protein